MTGRDIQVLDQTSDNPLAANVAMLTHPIDPIAAATNATLYHATEAGRDEGQPEVLEVGFVPAPTTVNTRIPALGHAVLQHQVHSRLVQSHDHEPMQPPRQVPQQRRSIDLTCSTQRIPTPTTIQHQSNKGLQVGNQQPTASARDSAERGRPIRQSLAATHPSNYAPKTPQEMPPPPLPHSGLKHIAQLPSPSPSTLSASPRPATPINSSKDVPWRQYTDPMWQTSTDPHYWENNHTILKSDRYLEPGNVISPTWMAGLPCGGMIEMAYHYPSLERAEREASRDDAMKG